MTTMRALVLTEQGVAFDPTHAAPSPAPGEAIVRVVRAGICNTDLELVKGYLGFRGVLGHEFVGVIEEIGPGRAQRPDRPTFQRGDRVVAEINCVGPASRSRDYASRAQDPERTTLGIVGRDGAFADLVRVPIANLHMVAGSVRDDEAVFVEPLAAACQVLEQVHVRTTDRVYVLGDGKLGLLCAQVLALTGCALAAVGRHEPKLGLLARHGIETRLLSEVSAQRVADIVVECTGQTEGFDLARRLLRPRGTLVLKSTFAGPTTANLTALVIDEITLVGSRCGPFASALRLLEEKRVDVAPLIDARYPLEAGVEALAHAARPGVLKVLLDVAR